MRNLDEHRQRYCQTKKWFFETVHGSKLVFTRQCSYTSHFRWAHCF